MKPENAAPCDVLRRHAAATPFPRNGYLPHEQQPDCVNRLLLDFQEGWAG